MADDGERRRFSLSPPLSLSLSPPSLSLSLSLTSQRRHNPPSDVPRRFPQQSPPDALRSPRPRGFVPHQLTSSRFLFLRKIGTAQRFCFAARPSSPTRAVIAARCSWAGERVRGPCSATCATLIAAAREEKGRDRGGVGAGGAASSSFSSSSSSSSSPLSFSPSRAPRAGRVIIYVHVAHTMLYENDRERERKRESAKKAGSMMASGGDEGDVPPRHPIAAPWPCLQPSVRRCARTPCLHVAPARCILVRLLR